MLFHFTQLFFILIKIEVSNIVSILNSGYIGRQLLLEDFQFFGYQVTIRTPRAPWGPLDPGLMNDEVFTLLIF